MKGQDFNIEKKYVEQFQLLWASETLFEPLRSQPQPKDALQVANFKTVQCAFFLYFLLCRRAGSTP